MAGQRLTDKTALADNLASDDLLMCVDVSDTTGSAEGTSLKIQNKFVIQTDKVSISSAEFQAMDSTGGAGTFKQLLLESGVGFGYVILGVTTVNTYVSVTDTSAANLRIGYAPSSSLFWVDVRRYMNGVSANATFTFGPQAASLGMGTTLDNNKVNVWASGNFNGDFTADFYITYQVVKL